MLLDYPFFSGSKAAQQPTGTRQPTRAAAQTPGIGRASRSMQPIALAESSKHRTPQHPPPAPIRASPSGAPQHGNATPEARRGILPPRECTTWHSTNAVVTVPGHRELHHGEPRNLVHQCPAHIQQGQPSRPITGLSSRPSPQRVSQLRATQSMPATPTLSTPAPHAPPKTFMDVARQHAARDNGHKALVPDDWDPSPGRYARKIVLPHLQQPRNYQPEWAKPSNSVEDVRPRLFRGAQSWAGVPGPIGGESIAAQRREREAAEGLRMETPLPAKLRKRQSAPVGAIGDGRPVSAASDHGDAGKTEGGKAPASSRLRRAVSRVGSLFGQFGGDQHRPAPEADEDVPLSVLMARKKASSTSDEDLPLATLLKQKKASSTSDEDLPLSVLAAQKKALGTRTSSNQLRHFASSPNLASTEARAARRCTPQLSKEVSPASTPLPPSPLASTPQTGQSTRQSTSSPPTATSSLRLSRGHSSESKRRVPLERTTSSQTMPAEVMTAGSCATAKRATPFERTAFSQTMPSLTVATDPTQSLQTRPSVPQMETKTSPALCVAPSSRPTAPARYRRVHGSFLRNPSVCGSIAEVQDEDDESSTAQADEAQSFVTAREFTASWGATEGGVGGKSEEQAQGRTLREDSGTPKPPDGVEAGVFAKKNGAKADVEG